MPMGPKLFNAVRLYIDGVRDGYLQVALDKYVSEDLIQRTPHIPPGRSGLAEHLAPMVDRYDRRIVIPLRGFEDGSSIFLQTLHSYGLRQIEHVSIDIFDTDSDDYIIEHWQVTSPLRAAPGSGHSQIDGPRHITDMDATGSNKTLVRRYVDDVLIGGRLDRIGAYVSTRAYVHHDPARGDAVRYRGVDKLVGAGNFVGMTGRCEAGGHPYAVAHLFRIDAGRIVEQWDTMARLDIQ
jgi:predicted SnoaL-like aldol condensation-catalyzing enzyme